MPFYKLPESELRDLAKRHIETLEFWMRRVVDEELSKKYGGDYWNYQDNGSFLINKEIRNKVSVRLDKYRDRFSRPIDASLLEHLLHIVYTEKLYKELFKEYFSLNYYKGRDILKLHFDKLSDVRNRLYHANPVSIRQVEQSVCYCNDIIDSIKHFYIEKNMHQDFNAPSIISYSDSTGKRVYKDQFVSSFGQILELKEGDVLKKFRSGDRVKFFIEIDSSFDKNSYVINWIKQGQNLNVSEPEIEVVFDNSWVSSRMQLEFQIISNKSWHRYSFFDDQLIIVFTVLPPIE